MSIKSLFEQFKAKLGDTQPIDDPELDTSITKLSADKIKAVIAELIDAEPIFNSAGFAMEEMDIEVGLVPKLTPKYKLISMISEQQEKQILEGLKERRLVRFLLISLLKSARIKNMLESEDMYLHQIEIDITAVPSVRSTFRKKATATKTESAPLQTVTPENTTQH